MTLQLLEPGTYRTNNGALIHCRRCADGSLRIERDNGERLPADDMMVKLSDDPDWPDAPRVFEPLLFSD